MESKRQTGPETRRTFHKARIGRERNGVLRFWWAAWWVVAELKALARWDGEAKAHQQGLSLADQLITFAEGLNKKHRDHLREQRGGRRVSA